MKLGANPGVIIESSHANRHLGAVRPIATKQTGTAVHTERFYCAFAFPVNFDQFFALEETELFLQYPRLRAHGRPGMLATAVAMTVIRLQKRGIDFKTHPATQAAATDRLFHVGILNRMHVVASWLPADGADSPAPRLRGDRYRINQNQGRVKHGDSRLRQMLRRAKEAPWLQHRFLTSVLCSLIRLDMPKEPSA